MATRETRPVKYHFVKKVPTKKQAMWNYMRRNRLFRVGDLMIILDMKKKTVKSILTALSRGGYIRLEVKAKIYEDREYLLLKNSGAVAPGIHRCGYIYDHNLKKKIPLKAKVKRSEVIAKVIEKFENISFCIRDILIQAIHIPEPTIRWVVSDMVKNKKLELVKESVGCKQYRRLTR